MATQMYCHMLRTYTSFVVFFGSPLRKDTPTGILDYLDWGLEPEPLFNLLRAGLSHNPIQRPQNGQALKERLQEIEDRL